MFKNINVNKHVFKQTYKYKNINTKQHKCIYV